MCAALESLNIGAFVYIRCSADRYRPISPKTDTLSLAIVPGGGLHILKLLKDLLTWLGYIVILQFVKSAKRTKLKNHRILKLSVQPFCVKRRKQSKNIDYLTWNCLLWILVPKPLSFLLFSSKDDFPSMGYTLCVCVCVCPTKVHFP